MPKRSHVVKRYRSAIPVHRFPVGEIEKLDQFEDGNCSALLPCEEGSHLRNSVYAKHSRQTIVYSLRNMGNNPHITSLIGPLGKEEEPGKGGLRRCTIQGSQYMTFQVN